MDHMAAEVLKERYFVGMEMPDFENHRKSPLHSGRGFFLENMSKIRGSVAELYPETKIKDFEPGTIRCAWYMKRRVSREYSIPMEKLHIYKEKTTVEIVG